MNFLNVVAALATAATLLAVGSGQVNVCFPGEQLEFAEAEFGSRIEIFGLSLFRELSDKLQGNIFISPYSVWSALALAYFGTEGETKRQLEFTLNVKSKTHTYYNWRGLRLVLLGQRDESGVILKTLNRAYMSDSLNLNRCVSDILPDLQLMDFRNTEVAINTINNDVSQATNGKIENFIDFLPPNTRFALINAIFFKGTWQTQFLPEHTRSQEFLVPPGRSAGNVDMMTQTGKFNFGLAPALDARILELPYENSTVSMFILLPNNISTDSITRNLTQEALQEVIGSMTVKNVQVNLPKFNMTTRIEGELKDALKRLGVFDLFVPGRANMTTFTRSTPLNVDAAIHEATVEVNEEGTVAAAATGLINTRLGIGFESFICNRPFVYVIYNKIVGITLFAGRYSKPT